MLLYVSMCTGPASTCLNWIIMSFDSSMSLNIPSSLLVNAAPHSVGSQNHNISHVFTPPHILMLHLLRYWIDAKIFSILCCQREDQEETLSLKLKNLISVRKCIESITVQILEDIMWL